MKALPLFAAVCLGAAAGALRAESASGLVEQARALDRQLKAAEALALYQRAETLEPKNTAIQLGIARQYRHLMADAPSPQEKLRLGERALASAKRAAALAPDSSEAQASIALSYGKLLPLESSKDQIETARRVKAAAERALRLDPDNDIAWHVLGRWHEGYADLSGIRRALGELLYGKLPTSTYDEAAECFRKALEANPRRLVHYIELGRVYAKMGRDAGARRLIEAGLAMPSIEKEDAEEKQLGRETLRTLH
jgi:tetratricopeptide (TPR) repeat protein